VAIKIEDKTLRTNDVIVKLITLSNRNGLKVTLCELGAAIWNISIPNRHGGTTDLVLGYEDEENWLTNPYFMGVTVGPVANRVAESCFDIDEQRHVLEANESNNCLHSGPSGLHSKFWLFESGDSQQDAWVKFVYTRPDGEGGFPGNLHLEVEYRITDDNCLLIKYRGSSDKTTPIALTNHSYFNLADDKSRGILDHRLQLFCDEYLPLNQASIPTGILRETADTAFDFRQPKAIGEDIDLVPPGYDHYFVLRRENPEKMRHAATLLEPESGRKMELHTTDVGLQFYSGCHMDGRTQQRGQLPLQPFSGLCLETHGFPNAVKFSHFPSVLVTPEQEYQHTNIYKFGF